MNQLRVAIDLMFFGVCAVQVLGNVFDLSWAREPATWFLWYAAGTVFLDSSQIRGDR